jgi:glucosamine kinase
MILIADSGSTKTTWCIIDGNNDVEKCITAGINPFLQSEKGIAVTLKNEFSLGKGPFREIYFYGAGCANPEKNDKVRRPLGSFFGEAQIFVGSDLMAAARSLCGRNPGIAAILGTGSNSCFYDGTEIKKHVSPLGYILGDEGSGTVLGRKLLSDILKNQLPAEICTKFYDEYKYSPAEILDKVYRQPFPNRFMAQFTHFLAGNIAHPAIIKLVKQSFTEFFNRNIRQFPEAATMPVNVTGSIGWFFRDILNEAASDSGFRTGIITRDPMEGLLDYHRKQ